MGVFNQDFTPELSPKTLVKKGNFCFFFQTSLWRGLGKIWAEDPPFSLFWPGLAINLVNFGPQATQAKGNHRED